MQNIIAVDFDQAAASPQGIWLVGGPGQGGACAVRAYALGPGKTEAGLQECSVDRFCFVVEGSGNAALGQESFALGRRAMVHIPAGAPHLIGNADVGQPLWLIDIFAAAPPQALFKPASARAWPNAAQQIRAVRADAFTKGGFAYQSLAERATGSQHLRVNFVEVQPGAGSPDYHIHEFDQFYFILEGGMTVDIGKRRQLAAKHHFVHLPAGIVHRNYNAGSVPEVHFALLAPEPAPGAIFDYAVDIHGREAELLQRIPA